MSVLRRLFGPSRAELWQQLRAETGGEPIPATFWEREKILVTHGEWRLILDTYFCAAAKINYTRLRAPYVNPDALRFTIYRRGLFSEIAKSLGMQDIEVGHPDFDRDFIIKGNQPAKVRALCANPRVRELIKAQPQIHLELRQGDGAFGSDFPAQTDELRFHTPGLIQDQGRLRQLFELFAEILNELCRLGSAYESDRP